MCLLLTNTCTWRHNSDHIYISLSLDKVASVNNRHISSSYPDRSRLWQLTAVQWWCCFIQCFSSQCPDEITTVMWYGMPSVLVTRQTYSLGKSTNSQVRHAMCLWSLVSLVGAATSIIFVGTKVLLQQTRVLFFFCFDKSMLVMAKRLSWQNYVCCNKHKTHKSFVSTSILLLRQKICLSQFPFCSIALHCATGAMEVFHKVS